MQIHDMVKTSTHNQNSGSTILTWIHLVVYD